MVHRVYVRFFSELNELQPPDRRERPIRLEVAAGTTVKDLAESLGVPHTEIDVILVNGVSVGFGHQVGESDRVDVYPVSEVPDVSPLVRLYPRPLREPRFVLDVHLGRLARTLRLLGFDAVWRNDSTDDELAAISADDERTLLTRDRGLLKRAKVTHGHLVRETDRRRQVVEVLRQFDLFGAITPFGRCLRCNGVLEPVAKAEVEHRLPPRTRREYADFRTCPGCGRIYWKGSHYDRLAALVEDLRRAGTTPLRTGTDLGRGPVTAPAGAGVSRPRHTRADQGPPPLAVEHAMGDAGSVRLEATPGGARAVDALDAAARGWSVIPVHTPIAGRCSCGDPSCPAVGKHARIPWKRRMSDAAGSEQVRRWWRRWPGANLGVVTGAVSGLVVLDIDPRNGGEGSLAALEDMHGPLPHTVESLTGGGGQHLYFRHPGVTVPCHPIAPGLDVKGDGGMVVCPPSTHVSGRDYAWEPGCTPNEAPLAELPGWVLARALDRASPRGRTGAAHHQVPVRTMGERAEFATLWHHVGIELRPGDHAYLCPFHPDHHPSLHIDAEGCRFYCFGCGRGGGSGRLRRLVDAPRRPGPVPDVAGAAPPGHLPAAPPLPTLPGTTEIRVVGNYAHQDALLELTGGRRHYGGVRMETVARLAPEPENTADPAAIAVTIGRRTVGYLSHPDAVTHRPAITAAIERSGEASCPALIVGGWEREHGDVGLFGVRLRLGGSTAEAAPRHADPPRR